LIEFVHIYVVTFSYYKSTGMCLLITSLYFY